MAAAYAAVVSLLNTMNLVQNHPLLSTSFDNYQNESLHEKADFLLDFVENHSDAVIREKAYFHLDFVKNHANSDSTEEEDLLSRIAVAAQMAEDIIEVEAVDRIRAVSTQQSPSFLPDLQKVIEDMDSIKEKVIKVKEETGFINHSMPPPSSSPPLATVKTTAMVGFDGYVLQLLDELTGHDSGLQIIPIIGMGGIGKTTLATNVYENSHIMRHFSVRVWVTVSQEFSARKIYLQALSCLGRSTSDTHRTDDQQLSHELYKILYNRRYLIVLDDIWSVEAWEKIKFFFPENNNRSRIVITTRLLEMVDYFGSFALSVNFLDDKNSWDLFREKTFAQEDCPPELEEVGKKIVKRCKGLPLTIVVIAGLLGKSSKTQEYWEKIAEDISLILNSGKGNELLSILHLSYKHLPVCLKSCFTYLGLFPEDHEIDVSHLIKLWVAEGFIKSKTNQSLEEVAESYLKDLVDRNLLLAPRRLRQNKKYDRCWVHDLVRDLCIRIAEKEDIFPVQRDIDGTHHFIVDERTTRFYPGESDTSETPSLIRPLILRGQRVAPFKSRLLRVLAHDKGHLDYTFRQVNLRFLYHNVGANSIPTYEFPSSISLLWSLQSLIIHGIFTLVELSEIWKMPQLRHIEMQSICLPDPPLSDDIFVLQNLQTLKKVHNLILSEEVCKRIPNIKDLHIHYHSGKQGEASYHPQNVGCLNKLESLRYSCGWGYPGGSLRNLKLPSSLKELILENCNLVWSDMAMIASLPHLEILQFLGEAVVGPEWNISVEEEFICLKHLKIDGCDDLIHWIADCSNFPVLETLTLTSLYRLDEIPSGIGEIPTLERIYVYDCRKSASISAVRILDEQESLGNQSLQLEVNFYTKTEAETLREKIEELGFTCQNLLIKSDY